MIVARQRLHHQLCALKSRLVRAEQRARDTEARLAYVEAALVASEALLEQARQQAAHFQALAEHRHWEIQRLTAELYGPRKERLVGNEAQLAFEAFEAALATIVVTAANDTNETDDEKKSKRRGDKKLRIDPSRCETVTRDVLPAQTHCEHCNEALVCIGADERRLLERLPARYRETILRYLKMACAHCKCGTVHMEPAVDRALEGCAAEPGFLADIALWHYGDHLPFHRISTMLHREGATIPRSTLARWMFKLGAQLQPIVKAMRLDQIATAHVIGTDGTGAPIQDSPRLHKGQFWVRHCPRHVLFHYSHGATIVGAAEGLEAYRGVVLHDAANVFEPRLTQAKHAKCNVHARRYFHRARESAPEHARIALGFYAKVARIEKGLKDKPPDERVRVRREKLKASFESFEAWCRVELHKALPRSPLATALQYASNHAEGLRYFLDDGHVAMDNNASERWLRSLTIGRKNWLFRYDEAHATAACVLWTLLASCKLHGVDARAYLIDVLQRLGTTKSRDVLSLTPIEWKRARERGAVQSVAA